MRFRFRHNSCFEVTVKDSSKTKENYMGRLTDIEQSISTISTQIKTLKYERKTDIRCMEGTWYVIHSFRNRTKNLKGDFV